jgi:hypothetical protein
MITDSIRGSSSAGMSWPQQWLPGDDLRRAVFGGEGINGPDRADAERWPGTRHAIEAIVEVQALPGLPGVELDRQVGGEQVVGREHLVQDRQHGGVLDQLRDHRGLGQEGIHALRIEALEVVPAKEGAAQIAGKGRLDPVDLGAG